MKRTFFLFLLFPAQCILAQDLAKNTVFVEAGGAALFYSVNYERLAFQNREMALGLRAGVMWLPSFGRSNRTVAGIPLGASLLKTLRNNLFEVGLTTALLSDTYEDEPVSAPTGSLNQTLWINSLRVGMRREVVGSGLFWNALAQFSHIRTTKSENPAAPGENQFIPFLSLGAGFSF